MISDIISESGTIIATGRKQVWQCFEEIRRRRSDEIDEKTLLEISDSAILIRDAGLSMRFIIMLLASALSDMAKATTPLQGHGVTTLWVQRRHSISLAKPL